MLGEPGSNQPNSPEAYNPEDERPSDNDEEFEGIRDEILWNDDASEDERTDIAQRLSGYLRKTND